MQLKHENFIVEALGDTEFLLESMNAILSCDLQFRLSSLALRAPTRCDCIDIINWILQCIIFFLLSKHEL